MSKFRIGSPDVDSFIRPIFKILKNWTISCETHERLYRLHFDSSLQGPIFSKVRPAFMSFQYGLKPGPILGRPFLNEPMCRLGTDIASYHFASEIKLRLLSLILRMEMHGLVVPIEHANQPQSGDSSFGQSPNIRDRQAAHPRLRGVDCVTAGKMKFRGIRNKRD
jgi:hypothetical protein